MNAIRVSELYGTDVSSRAHAAQLRIQIINSLCPTCERTTVDFTGVRTISDSFADELFGVLVEECGEDWFRQHIEVLGLDELTRATILEAVADRLNLA